MKYTYIPRGICPSQITIELEDDIVKNIDFIGGCNGNLQAVSALLAGMSASQVSEKLAGIRCGHKKTSCADQLVKGIDEALKAYAAAEEQ